MDGASVDHTASQGDVPPPFAADAAVNEELQAAPEEDNVNDVPPPQQQPWNDEGESAADLPPPTTFYDAEGEEQAASDNDQPKEPSPALNQESYDASAVEETQPAKPVGRVAVAAGTAGSLVARLAARRMQLLAEPVLSEETVATVEDTAAALAELRVLEAAAAAAEAADRGEAPKAKHHRAENQDPEKELESDRTELGKQIKRLLKWAMTAEPWGPAQLTEDIFVALVCSLAVIRGRVAPLANPTEDAAKVEEAASQTYDELFNGSSVMKSDWRNKVDQLLGVAAPPKQTAAPSNNGANVRASTNNNTSNNNNTPAAAAPQADRPPAYTAALNITPAEFGFNAAEVRAIEYAHEPAFRDIVALQLYVFKTNSTVPQASERLKIPMSVVGRRDIFRIPRLLDRFRVDRSFEPVSSVHPSMPKSWDVTCRLIGFARVRYFVGNPREVVTGRVCIITDLRGRPVYTGNTIRRTEREAWDAAYKEVHGSHWFTPSKAQYLVGPPQLKGLPRIMCVATEDNSPQAVQQNTMLARLLRPMADLIDHVETFRILQESHNLDPMTLLGIVRYVAHAHGVVAKHGR